jgi:hypothetical protein
MTQAQQTTAGLIDENEVHDSVEETLDALVETMPVLLEASPAVSADSTLSATIAISGEQPATVTVRAGLDTCARLAVGWALAGPDDPSISDAVDAMGEFANIIGGSVKSIFECESSLGLPAVEVLEAASGPGDWADLLVVDHRVGRIGIRIDRE